MVSTILRSYRKHPAKIPCSFQVLLLFQYVALLYRSLDFNWHDICRQNNTNPQILIPIFYFLLIKAFLCTVLRLMLLAQTCNQPEQSRNMGTVIAAAVHTHANALNCHQISLISKAFCLLWVFDMR